MNFAFTDEQEELRNIVRQFLENKSDETAVREQMETEQGYDEAVWSQMAEQMGLQSLIIPEEYGGSGYSYVELIVVLEEMGRALLCAPYFSTVVLAGNTLLQSGDEAAKKDILPGIASGETIATLAFTEENGRWDEAGISHGGHQGRRLWYALSGTKMFVLDGHIADLIIVAARTDAGVVALPRRRRRRGLTRTPLSTMDQTRKQARLDLRRRRRPRSIGTDGEGWAVLEHGARPRRRRARRRAGRRRPAVPRHGRRVRQGPACSSAARSARSRPSSTSAPTCCSRSSRPSRPPTTPAGAPPR